MKIKIKTIDSNEYLIEIQKDALVTDLKSRIESVTQVPCLRQRLIFQGKLLQDKEKLSFYKISDLNVVHLVAKAGVSINNTEEQRTTNSNETNSSRSGVLEYLGQIIDEPTSSFADIVSTFRERELNSSTIGNNSNGTRSKLVFNKDRPLINRRVRSNINSSVNVDFKESKEVIKQNVLSINNLLDNLSSDVKYVKGVNENDSDNTNNNLKLEFLDHKKRRLIKGQWVDVKDTINEWLEAQVIDVKDNKAFIHYNGWGNRWDEWINMDSDRIQIFRSHTTQNTLFNYLSPFPSTKPDASVSLIDNGAQDFLDFMSNIKSLNTDTNKLIDDILTVKNNVKNNNKNMIVDNEEKSEIQKGLYLNLSKISPFLDRYGRLLTDIGQYISNSLKSKNYENFDNDLFKTQDFKDIFEKTIEKDVNTLQTPLNIQQTGNNNSSFFDIVVHTTYISPFTSGNNSLREGGGGSSLRFLDLLNLPVRSTRSQNTTENINNPTVPNSETGIEKNQTSSSNNNISPSSNLPNVSLSNDVASTINIPLVEDTESSKLLSHKRDSSEIEKLDKKKDKLADKKKQKKKKKDDDDESNYSDELIGKKK